MTSKELDTGVTDPPREIAESESELKEEVYRLKHQMAEMYQAWVRGHPPPSFPANYPENPAFIPPLSQAQDPITIDLSPQHAPGFTPYRHYPSTSSQTFYAPPAKTTAYPAPTSAPIFAAPLRSTLHRSSSEPAFQAPDTQYYVPEPTFKVANPYSHAPHFEPLVETEKPSWNVEQDEMFRKVKSLEKSLKNMQGIGSQVSVAYKDLCLFPDVQLPAGFKMPKFDLYDGHGDPLAHLRGFCSNMRGAGGKDELLMAYFSQSLSGAALEWYTRQDTSRWYTWDDLAQAFAWHFQYNIDIVPDRQSLTKVEKRPNESFREYGFRWKEQAARVYPPMEEDEMVEYFRQALEPTYFGHLISAIVKGVSVKPSVLVVKEPPVDVEANQKKQKVIETYKGKEVEEEVNETGGLTRSGRCFTPEEMRKTKLFKDGHIPVKKPVTEEEAEEFLKKMKMQDYSIVEQLRKTPAQISLLITFSDDELPIEGTEHNRALYLTVKCEDSAVSKVLVDNGSSTNICPLSTLRKLKIGTERIHINNVCVRGFDGGGKDSVGDIMLNLSIGPAEFTMEFQVLDVAVSYNLLLGRP
ncbi:uncharacterized protein [Nicotiana tomentosiformis]|uniref:uncharacterized protein n=1 Tax=Nicotiana tomentosiformis TaxID=4098 RepID=UPI00388C7093